MLIIFLPTLTLQGDEAPLFALFVIVALMKIKYNFHEEDELTINALEVIDKSIKKINQLNKGVIKDEHPQKRAECLSKVSKLLEPHLPRKAPLVKVREGFVPYNTNEFDFY